MANNNQEIFENISKALSLFSEKIISAIGTATKVFAEKTIPYLQSLYEEIPNISPERKLELEKEINEERKKLGEKEFEYKDEYEEYISEVKDDIEAIAGERCEIRFADVQKEAADRMCAKVGSRASGAVTVAVWHYSEPEILFKVSAGSFLPPPKVDSAVMRLMVRQQPEYDVGDEERFRALVKAGFSQRRKTLVNSVCSDRRFGKDAVCAALEAMGLEQNARIEQLTMEQLAELSRRLG